MAQPKTVVTVVSSILRSAIDKLRACEYWWNDTDLGQPKTAIMVVSSVLMSVVDMLLACGTRNG
jgi:hypothetical protein